MKHRIGIMTTIALLVLVPTLSAEETGFAVGETVELYSGTLTVENDEGQRTFTYDSDISMPSDLEVGDPVVVQYSGGEALAILELHDQVEVSQELSGERRAVYGTVKSTSTEQVIVDTSTGGQAFVIQAGQLFPPVPQAGDKVAVIYRVESTQTRELTKGERLVVLPADYRLPTGGDVEVSSTSIPQPEPAADPSFESQSEPEEIEGELGATEPAGEAQLPSLSTTSDATAVAETLPQTASPLWLLGALGFASLGGGLAVRTLRK